MCAATVKRTYTTLQMNPVSQNMPTLLTHATLLLLGLLCFQFLFAFSAIRNWSGRHRAREAQGQEARSQRGPEPEPERPRLRDKTRHNIQSPAKVKCSVQLTEF